MGSKQIEKQQEEIIDIGKEAYSKGLIVARGGNLSIRLNSEEFLMTAHTAALGFLKDRDFLVMDLKSKIVKGSIGENACCPHNKHSSIVFLFIRTENLCPSGS